jgi:LysM repeat protein
LNKIVNPNLIFPGQVLQVSGAVQPTPPTPQPTQVPAQPPSRPGTHVVQPGENLFRISLQYNLTWDVLARANGIFNPNLIFPGQVLVIP